MLGNDTQLQIFLSVFKSGVQLSYNKGEYIIRPGETPSHVYYIDEGFVKALNITKYGEENLLIIRKSHEIFPLIWSITGKGKSIIYQTLTPTKVYRISRDKFGKFLKENTDALYPFIDLITSQYRVHSERVMNLEYRSVRERLASFLLTMAKRFGSQTKNTITINVPLIQQDIASSINASRETTSREIGILERKGLIKTSQSIITIIDKKALKNLL